MNNRKKYVGFMAFFAIMLAVIYVMIFNKYDINEISTAVKQCDTTYLLLGLGMIVVFFIFGAEMIRVSLKELGYKKNFWKNIVYAATEFFFSGITPSSTGGQPVQAYYMAKDGIEVKHSAIILLLIAAIYKIILVIFGFIILAFEYSLIEPIKVLFIIGMVINIAMAVIFVMAMFSQKTIFKLGSWFITVGGKLKIISNTEEKISKFSDAVDGYIACANFVKDRKMLLFKVTILTILQRFSIFIIPFFMYKALGLTEYGAVYFISVQILISLGIDSIPMPGGIGIGEVMNLRMYSSIYPSTLIAPAMLLNRVVGYYLCLLISAIITTINHADMLKREKVT